MTPNIFKKIIYHSKTTVNCLFPKIFFTAINLVISLRSITIIIQQVVPKCIHIWWGQVTWQGTTVNSLFFFPKWPQYPSDSKPNTVACSKFEFSLNCQKDTETAMRLVHGSL